MVHPPVHARWGAAAGRNQPGLVVHNSDVARKLLYGKRELVSGAKTRNDVTVPAALLASRFGDLRKVMETAVQSAKFDRRDLSHFIANSRPNLRFVRAVAIVEHYNRVGKIAIKGQHYGQLMGIANTEGLWQESMAMFAALTHRSEYGPVAAEALRKPRSQRDGRELLLAAQPHVPHAHAYGHLMYACRLGGRWRAACVAFNQLVADNVPPTDGLVQDAVRSLSMSPDWRHALVAFSTFTSSASNEAEPSYSPGISAYKQLLWHVTHADVPNSWEATLKIVGDVAAAAVDVHAGGAGARLAELQALEHAEQAMEEAQSRAAKDQTREVAAAMARADGAEPFDGEDYSDDYVAPSGDGDGELGLDDTEGDGIVGSLRQPAAVAGSFDDAEDPALLVDEAITDAITLPSTLGPNGLDAGLLGTALRACASAGKWELGISIFNDTTVNGARSHVACNGNTMQHLSELRPRDALFQVAVMNHTFETGFTVVAPMYTQVFTSLAGAGRSDEALALFYKLYDSVVNDVTNIQVSLGELYNGMIGALLAHPAPAEAAVMARELQGTLEAAVIECTGCLGSWGDDAQLWTAEGRVAVVDASMVLDRPALAALTQSFDNVVIPYSELRRVIADAENQPGNVSSDHAECVHYLKRLVVTTSGGVAGRSPYRVLPFVHELRALSLLQSLQSAFDRHYQQQQQQRQSEDKRATPRLQMPADSGLLELMSAEARMGGDRDRDSGGGGGGDSGAIPTIIPDKHLRGANAGGGSATWAPAANDDTPDVVTSAKKALARAADAVEVARSADPNKRPRTPHFVVRSMLSVTGQRAGCIATAAMLKRHNPDAQISVVTEDRKAHKQFGMVGTALQPLLAASAPVGPTKHRNTPRPADREPQPATSGFDSHLGSRVRADVVKNRKRQEKRLQAGASAGGATGGNGAIVVASDADRVAARRSDLETQRDAISWIEAAMQKGRDGDHARDAPVPLREPAFWFPA